MLAAVAHLQLCCSAIVHQGLATAQATSLHPPLFAYYASCFVISVAGLEDRGGGSLEGESPTFKEVSGGHARNSAYTTTMPPDG